jgi:16S rRNA (adenine1518-N6/adenine1519-N6)-dimethyltransferase
VTSSVITLVPRTEIIDANKDILEEVARITFGQRRKTLKSSLKQITKQPDLLLDKAGIEASRRPEELTIAEFCLLARVYEEVKNERTS